MKPTLFKKLASAVMLLAILILNVSPALALDVQVLPENTVAKFGYTHVIKIKYTDVTNSLANCQYRFVPGSGTFLANTFIDRAGLLLTTPFYVAEANAGSNSVFLSAGITGATNNVLSGFMVGSNRTTTVFTTNLLAPVLFSGATNSLTVSLSFSNDAMPALLLSGEVSVFVRALNLPNLKF
jgi:hypothetical protein